MIPAFRTYLLLLLGTAIVLVGVLVRPELLQSSSFFWCLGAILAWDILVLMLAALESRAIHPNTLQITRTVAPKLSIGRDNLVTLQIIGGDRPAQIQIADSYPIAFQSSATVLSTTLMPQQSPQTSQNLTYTVFPRQRGQYEWGKIQVRQLGPLGLAWRQWTIAQPQTVAVYPDLIGLRSLSVRLALQSTGNIRRTRRLGNGTEFSELREYNTDDDPRLIDWKATARRSRPLVRVLEPEQEQTLIILLDRGRLMTAKVNGLARFDWGLNAALSLALTGLNRGDRVGFGVFDRDMTTWIPPERGQHHLSKLIERLTPLQPTFAEPDYVNAITALTRQQPRRSLVVLLTDIVDQTASAELLAAMGRLAPRYLPFCVALRDPQIDRQAQTSGTDPEQLYHQAIALDLLSQRRVAMETLKQRGALVLDAPADKITDDLVNQYLQIKTRGRL